jgi:hypothetical protein
VSFRFPAFVGVNLPWHVYGCDFGGNGWYPDGGIGRPHGSEALDPLFERLSGAGLRVVRWFMFCDGRAGIRFDRSGTPAGLDAHVFRDVDAALALAAAHKVTLLFVVFDFPWFRPPRSVNGVALFGRRDVVALADRRRALLDRVVAPVFKRYGREPLVEAWDLVNEPEWATLGWGARLPWRALRAGTMAAWLGEMTDLAHAEARQPVTVGLASARGLPLVAGCGLDFYQVHWYDKLERRSPLAEPPVAELDRPLVLGEFPTASTRLDAAEVIVAARAAGYAAVLAWSASSPDAYSHLPALEEALGHKA